MIRISKIRSLCKARGAAYLYTDRDAPRQWISDGVGMWPIDGLTMDEDSMGVLLEIPPDKWLNKFYHREIVKGETEADIFDRIGDACDDEEFLAVWPMRLIIDGTEYIAARRPGGGTVIFEAAEVVPALSKDGDTDYALRSGEGSPLVAIYNGLLPAGFVAPLTAEFTETALDELRKRI